MSASFHDVFQHYGYVANVDSPALNHPSFTEYIHPREMTNIGSRCIAMLWGSRATVVCPDGISYYLTTPEVVESFLREKYRCFSCLPSTSQVALELDLQIA